MASPPTSCLLLLFVLFPAAVNSYNYLVINPVFGYSHYKFMTRIADTLADAGHNVTMFQPFHAVMKNMDGVLKNKNVEVVNFYPSNFKELEKNEPPTFSFMWNSKIVSSPAANAILFPNVLANEFKNTATEMLQHSELFEQLKSKNFDAFVVETFDTSGFYLGHLLEIPTSIAAFSGVKFPALQELFGQASPLGYAPAYGSQHGPEAGFLDRLNNVYTEFFEQINIERVFGLQHDVYVKALGESRKTPHWKELITRASIFVTNANPYLNFAEPTVGSIIQIGGFTMDPAQSKKVAQLPEEYDKIMEERKYTVFISFGSVIRSYQMPENFKSGVIQMFKNLPDVTFIWKYEQSEDAEFKKRLPSNVHLKKWVPQQAILADPRLSLFVTHGGLGSTMEVAYSGIAALMVPVFGDQPRNAMMLARHGGAIAYNKFDLADSQKLTETIKEMITNSRYKTAAVELQNVLHNQPIDYKDRLVKNAEFAVKFPKLKSQVPEIRSAGYIGYYYIDVFAFLAIVAIALLYISFRVSSSLLNKISSRFIVVKSKSESKSKPE